MIRQSDLKLSLRVPFINIIFFLKVEMEARRLVLKFIGYEIVDDHVEYRIGLRGFSIQSNTFQARYSVLREIYSQLKVLIPRENLPFFPPKRWFGNKDFAVIRERSKALEDFFKTLLENFTLDELPPLKELLEPYIREIELRPLVAPDPLREKLKGISQEFYDMERKEQDRILDTEQEQHETLEKKRKYQAQVRINWDTEDMTKKKLPEGRESNVAEIRKELLSLKKKQNIAFSMNKVLDDITTAMSKIEIPDMSSFVYMYKY